MFITVFTKGSYGALFSATSIKFIFP